MLQAAPRNMKINSMFGVSLHNVEPDSLEHGYSILNFYFLKNDEESVKISFFGQTLST